MALKPIETLENHHEDHAKRIPPLLLSILNFFEKKMLFLNQHAFLCSPTQSFSLEENTKPQAPQTAQPLKVERGLALRGPGRGQEGFGAGDQEGSGAPVAPGRVVLVVVHSGCFWVVVFVKVHSGFMLFLGRPSGELQQLQFFEGINGIFFFPV